MSITRWLVAGVVLVAIAGCGGDENQRFGSDALPDTGGASAGTGGTKGTGGVAGPGSGGAASTGGSLGTGGAGSGGANPGTGGAVAVGSGGAGTGGIEGTGGTASGGTGASGGSSGAAGTGGAIPTGGNGGTCATQSDCPSSDYVCLGTACVYQPWICTGLCSYIGGPCDPANQCVAGLSCVSGVCTWADGHSCAKAADCAGGYCYTGLTGILDPATETTVPLTCKSTPPLDPVTCIGQPCSKTNCPTALAESKFSTVAFCEKTTMTLEVMCSQTTPSACTPLGRSCADVGWCQ